MKAILVHSARSELQPESQPGEYLGQHVAGLASIPRRALSLPVMSGMAAVGTAADVSAITAFVELWGPDKALRAAVATWPTPISAWLVDESIPADAPRTWPVGEASPGVRLVSSVYRKQGLDRREFSHHWRTRHVEIAMSYTIPVWRYSQNVVVEVLRPGDGEDGFAVLHFRTAEDLAARWSRYPVEARRGADDASRFMDPGRGWSVAMIETVWED